MISNWEESFNHFEEVVVSGSEAMKVKAILNLVHVTSSFSEDVLARTIPILAKILGENSSWPVHQAAAYCLKQIASQGDGPDGRLATEIGQSGVVCSVLRLLPQADNGFQRVLVKCLGSLVTFGKVNRVIVARNGGVEIIIDMLNSCNDGTRKYLLEILSALALLREVRRVIVGLGGLRFLVKAAEFGSMVSRERACQAIGLLGVSRRARHILVELGVIPVLVELFRIGDGTTKLVAGNSLGVISAHVDYIRPVAEAGAIPLYAELLQRTDPIGKEIAEDVFCILAVAEANAVSIVEHLVRILREGDDEAKTAAADVLWDLSGYKHSTSFVRSSGAIPVLVGLLSYENDEVKEKVSGAIAQLSYNELDRVALAEAGAVPIMIELLHDESDELRDNAAEALINFSDDPLQRELISEAIGVASFQSMQNRLIRLRASDEHMARSMRRMSIDQLTWDPDLV
ncbi:hypothetical protein Patl1_04007 [Pistacia atlantica]|uniref:Uncharacterized protein n=1 Tax=Pistacia atlantica TaxID=434234 RepID=A0ACC1BSV4_9ROSI|nr:hypothetical protein Patl1_04007 [Pistacia atlantica]